MHNSEKVLGTLEQQVYARVQDEAEAGMILHNTSSIRRLSASGWSQ